MREGETSPEAWFHEVATHYVLAQVLHHLNRVGVLVLLDREGPLAAGEIASRLGLVPEVLETALDHVAAVDRLLERDAGGRFAVTPFGRAVFDRYSRREAGSTTFNLFDVRAGAYGPVWASLDRLLTGEVRYGKELVRRGEIAAGAVYTIGARLAPPLLRLLDRLGSEAICEIGVTTGLLQRVRVERPGIAAFGLDRDPEALREAERRARESAGGEAPGIAWLRGDVFEPEPWVASLPAGRRGVLFSVHFHELCAGGEDRLVSLLRELGRRLPGWDVVAFEQPRLLPEERGRVPETLWLYNASNVLIHHLVGNGRILTDEGWRDLFRRAGAAPRPSEPLSYLGYEAYTFALRGEGPPAGEG